jgi:hypothetical protein
MIRPPTIRPVDTQTIHEQQYDLFLAVVGYELRARFIAEHIRITATERIAIGFKAGRLFNYEENARWYDSANFAVYHLNDTEFDQLVTERLLRLLDRKRSGEKVRICVDISSLTRVRMAMLVRLFAEATLSDKLEVHFLYSLAAFSPPPSSTVPNRHVGPVLASFSGWWTAPERPVAAAVGLGYEENKALGAVEHVQASSIWTFEPVSPITEYSPALDKANSTLLNLVPLANKFHYRVDRPFDIFVALESFTFGITRDHNLVLLPFGPKVFALCALLVGILHPEVAVWRVSGAEEPTDRQSSGQIYGLGMTTQAQSEVSEDEEALSGSKISA